MRCRFPVVTIVMGCFFGCPIRGGSVSWPDRWETPRLILHLNPTHCPVARNELRQQLTLAIAHWNQATSPTLTLNLAEKDSRVTVADFLRGTSPHSVTVLCDPHFSTNNRANSHLVSAATRTGANNPISYGGILLNVEKGKKANIARLGKGGLGVTIAHEIGHLLGLEHNKKPSSLMYYRVDGKRKIAFSHDDHRNIAKRYPRASILGKISQR